MTEFAQHLRHYCRNPHCRTKLAEPTDIAKAFCTPGCHSSFYRSRCIVCEQPIERKTERQRVCGKSRCHKAFRRRCVPKGHQPPTSVTNAIKSPIKSGIKSDDFGDRTPHVVAGPKITACVYHCAALPVDVDTARRINVVNNWDRIRKEISWSKPRPPAPKEVQSDWKPCSPSVPVAEDLIIPDFLKREPAAVSESPEAVAAE